MTGYKLTDVEALARGETLPTGVLDAILADPEGVRRLDDLLRLRSLVEEDEPLTPIDTDVTLKEAALYARGELGDEARRAAVEALLAQFVSREEEHQTAFTPAAAVETVDLKGEGEGPAAPPRLE